MVVETDEDVTVEDLEAAGLEDLFSDLEDAVYDHRTGDNTNVAVISKPLAGRGVLLDYAKEFLGPTAERVSFSSVVTDGLPELPDSEVVLVDDCHYLYARRVGGFDALDRFLAKTANSDTLYVTSWNRYAWNYLAAVRDLDRDFPVRISIPELDSTRMANLLTSHYGSSLPRFVDPNSDDRVRTVDVDSVTVPLGEQRSVEVPRPELNLEYVTSLSVTGVETDHQAVVFEKVTDLSEGDPGVALAIWERSVRDGRIAPSYVQEVDRGLDLDDDQAFVLEVVLTNERISRTQLAETVRSASIERVLGSLRRQGAIDIVDGDVRIVPEMLHTVVEHLERRQLIW